MNAFGCLAVACTLVACGPIYPQQPPPSSQQTSAPPSGNDPDRDPASESGDPETDPTSEVDEPARAPTPSKSSLPPEMQAVLDSHNAARANHCASPLTWSPKLAASAQKWASSLAANNCAFEHSNTQLGENLAGGTAGSLDGKAITAMWYDEVAQYNFKRPGFAMSTGHFTQVVWKATRQIGCGRASCGNRQMDIWVCHYDPAGNYDGQFPANVAPRGCK